MTSNVNEVTLLSPRCRSLRETSRESTPEGQGLRDAGQKVKFIFSIPNLSKTACFSYYGAKLRITFELFVRNVDKTFIFSIYCLILIYVPISIWISFEGIVDYIIAVALYVLSIGTCKLSIMNPILLRGGSCSFCFFIQKLSVQIVQVYSVTSVAFCYFREFNILSIETPYFIVFNMHYFFAFVIENAPQCLPYTSLISKENPGKTLVKTVYPIVFPIGYELRTIKI